MRRRFMMSTNCSIISSVTTKRASGIFGTIESAIGRLLRPPLMSPELTAARGIVPRKKRLLGRCSARSAIARRVAYLRRDSAKTLGGAQTSPP
jgi:hypothetical protein